ncbi:hypothetical protein, partial [Bremerella cremea]|uniref:hypothetical protein n=1 Tax=Bremerella cremea TaxID=1031537 RepID=UPI001BE06B67
EIASFLGDKALFVALLVKRQATQSNSTSSHKMPSTNQIVKDQIALRLGSEFSLSRSYPQLEGRNVSPPGPCCQTGVAGN